MIIIILNGFFSIVFIIKATEEYRIAGYFRGVYISRTANSILVREKYFTNGDTEPRHLHINYFSFRGLAVLSRNSQNINRLENNPLYGNVCARRQKRIYGSMSPKLALLKHYERS